MRQPDAPLFLRVALTVVPALVLTLACAPDAASPTELRWSVVDSGSVITSNELTPVGLSTIACSPLDQCWAMADGGYGVKYVNGRWHEFNPENEFAPTQMICRSDTDCLAFGSGVISSDQYSGLAHFDGRSWRQVPTSADGSGRASAIACPTDGSECMVTMDSDTDSGMAVFAHVRDSKLHDQHTVANQDMYAVTSMWCASATECWVAGMDRFQRALIAHYDGSNLVAVPSLRPVNGTGYSLFRQVVCARTDACWAWGGWSGGPETFVARLDTTGWHLQGDLRLRSFACPTTHECWALGEAERPSTDVAVLSISHWTGTSWMTPARLSSSGGGLGSLVCPSATTCWAVGVRDGGGPMIVVGRMAQP